MNGMIIFIIFILVILVLLIITLLITKKILIKERFQEILKKYTRECIKNFPINIKCNSRVVVSLTTIPKRIKYLPKIIECIKNQTYQPDKIYINIPYYFKRKNEYYQIPTDWKFDDNIYITRCEDYGPATKLIGSLEFEKDDDTIIITIDDDHNYHNNIILQLVTYAMIYPEHCISKYGQLGPNKYISHELIKDRIIFSPYLKYIEGFGGALYRRKYINDDMINYLKKLSVNSCYKSDDMTISTWILMNNGKLLTYYDYNHTDLIEDIDKFDALHREDREDTYIDCFVELDKLQFKRKYIWIKAYNYVSDKYEPYVEEGTFTTLDENNYKDINYGDIICIRTRHLNDFIKKIFLNLKVPIVLVTVDDDFIIPNDLWKDDYSKSVLKNLEEESKIDNISCIKFDNFVKDKRLIHWFCQNLNGEYLCDKLSHLPIGIDYHTIYYRDNQHPYSQEKILEQLRISSIPLEYKPISVYGNFQHNNTSRRFKNVYGEDRKSIYEQLKNCPLVHFESKRTDQYTFWKNMNKHSFVISPLGNGLDCHRTWEILIFNCIPIVKTSVLDRLYDDLPVIIINNWNDITLDNLIKWKKWVLDNKTKFNYDKLTIDYWSKQFYYYKTNSK